MAGIPKNFQEALMHLFSQFEQTSSNTDKNGLARNVPSKPTLVQNELRETFRPYMERSKGRKLQPVRPDKQVCFTFVCLSKVWNTEDINKIPNEEDLHHLQTRCLGEKMIGFSINSSGEEIDQILKRLFCHFNLI